MIQSLSHLAMPAALPFGILAVAAVMFVIWHRDERLRSQRQMLRRAYELGEEILGSSSAAQILERVKVMVPKIFGVSAAGLYLYNRHAKTLDPVDRGAGEPPSIPLSAPPSGPQAGAVACFHYRTLLAIPDTARSPFPVSGPPGSYAPRSLLFVPMLAQGEVLGVLRMDQQERARVFSRDEQTLTQHLANQIGVAVKLLDQRSVREQLFRTEKLAAVGQLISGIVNDLRTPLASIASLAQAAQASPVAPSAGLAEIRDEALRAADIVDRLVGFADTGPPQTQPVELNGLLRNLIEFREREWKVRGIRARNLLAEESATVLGSHGQLEQVFLNLLVHAEQSISDESEKSIVIRSSLVARRVLVEIGYSGPQGAADPFVAGAEDAAGSTGLGVCRGLIISHGGEIRFVQQAAGDPAFQVELPCAAREKAVPSAENGHAAHTLTALLIEPADAIQAQLRDLLAGRGYRVVPVNSSDEGLDLAQRMRFDAIFCSVRAPGLNWVETAEQVKTRGAGFVLLSDSYDAELAAGFEGDRRFVLAKPVDERQLDRVLEAIRSGAR